MADKKISQLTSASTPLAGTEVLPIVQSGATVKVAVSDLTAGRAVSALSYAVTGTTAPANGTYLYTTNSLGFSSNSGNAGLIDASRNWRIGHTYAPSTTTKFSADGAYNSTAPSTSSNVAVRAGGGGAVSIWLSAYAYSYGWIQAIQDDGTNNLKSLYLNPLGGGVAVGASGHPLQPNSDNAQTLGASGARWSVVYAGTGTINTSDGREKQDVADLDEAEKRVAVALKSLVKKFRFKDAVAVKGEAARIHVGVVAQEVIAAFQAEGLDPMRYALVCYDEWPDKYDDVYDDEKNPTGEKVLVTAAGNRYGVRYDELLAFIISAL